jgi:flagellar biosynthesis protein FlhF
MKLKTYRAHSMAEALSAVKKDLGKNAVILHTRSVKIGGILGFRKKTVVEITAADEPVPTARRGAAPRPKPETVPPAKSAPQPQPILAATAALNAYRKAAESSARPPMATPSPARIEPKPTADQPTLMTVRERRLAENRPEKPARSNATPLTEVAGENLYRELADIKLLVNQVLHSAQPTSVGAAAGAMPDALFRHYLRLLESSVSRDIADSIIGAVRDELTPGEMHDESIVRTTVLRHIADLIPIADVLTRPSRGEGPLVIALVGPTGVGKTTTIAKLAAAYKLRHGKSVALITSDTYRIAAVDQLRTYAGIIGLPLKVVLSPEEMAQAVESLRDYDVVLIDTAGRSQFNADRIAELRSFVDAASPNEVHLVLSSAANEAVLTRTAESFAALRPNRVILTKLDEAVNFGVIVNVTRRLQTALSFVTTGQEVPDDIEQGQPDRLARMVLDNTLVGSQPPSRQRRADSGAAGAEREALLVGAGGGPR